MEAFHSEQRFVTATIISQPGSATGDDVRQTVIRLFQDEQQQFATLRHGMQELLDSTNAMAAGFTERATAASTESANRTSSTAAELASRDAQLMEHINTDQGNSNAALELLTIQLTTFTAGKQAELQNKVD